MNEEKVAKNIEIEAKFLEIDIAELKKRLREAGAADLGQDLIKDIIFYDKDRTWIAENKFVRIRQTNKGISVTYKHDKEATLTGTIEIEFEISDMEKVVEFLEAIGLVVARDQEKKRHSFILNGVSVDIDTWPKIPTYVELEGPTEEAVKSAAAVLGFNWTKAVFGTAPRVMEDYYKFPVRTLRYYTFGRME